MVLVHHARPQCATCVKFKVPRLYPLNLWSGQDFMIHGHMGGVIPVYTIPHNFCLWDIILLPLSETNLLGFENAFEYY